MVTGNGKVIHLIIKNDSSRGRQHQCTKCVVDGSSHGHRVPVHVHNAEVTGAMIVQLTPSNTRESINQSIERENCCLMK